MRRWRARAALLMIASACSDGAPAIVDARGPDAPGADGAVTGDAGDPDAPDRDASASDGAELDASTIDAAAVDASTIDAAAVDASTIDGPGLDGPATDASLCGNGTVDPGETCDGNCPTACTDTLACTTDALVGSPTTCNVACTFTGIGCISADGCCSPGCDGTTDSDCSFTIDPAFDPSYDVRDVGNAVGVPTNYGGLTIDPADPSSLLIGGAANNASGGIYRLGVQRDQTGHIVGLTGPAVLARAGAYNDGGVVFSATGVLVVTRYPVHELGMQRAGSTTFDKIVALGPLGIPSSVGGLTYVPAGFGGAGQWKSVSYSGGAWFDLTLTPDATGTYDVTLPQQRATLGGGPEGIAYVPLGSPLFPTPSVLVSEYLGGMVAAYQVDAQGDPIVATRRTFIAGLTGAEGAAIDPVSGDFLFSTFGGGNRILVVRGFAP